MSEPAPGSIVWTDLTVDDAGSLKDFYADVVGWHIEPTPMGGYDDFTVGPKGSDGIAGICHARGSNAGMPPAWLNYVAVANLDASMASCEQRGGEIVHGPAGLAGGRFCVIKDPIGAHLALFETPDENQE